MSINDNVIIDTLKESPERGFRMLMMKYREPLYWHIRRLVVSHDDARCSPGNFRENLPFVRPVSWGLLIPKLDLPHRYQ